MELAWIDDFLALQTARNFTRAAETRHTTQPAFSRRIQRLEEWLGARLFERDASPVTLTPAGAAFAERARRLREDILDARRATLSVTSHFAETVRIFTTNTIAISFLPSWLARQKFENYSLVVASITGCLEAIRQRRADLALVSHFEDDDVLDDFHPEILAEDFLSLVAAPKICSRVRLHQGCLSGPLMAYAPGTAYGAQIAKKLAQLRVTLDQKPLCESASAEALLAQAETGLGAAWLPRLLIGRGLKRCAVPANFDVPYSIALVRPDKFSTG